MSSSKPPTTPLSSAKRRRVDANATLTKPFRSPLIKKPGTTAASPSAQTPSSAAPSTPSSPLTTSRSAHTPSSRSIPSTPFPRRQRPFGSPLKTVSTSPAIVALQKEHTALTNQLRETRQSLATAQQAADLESSTKDAALERDILRWRDAGRSAAEALFAAATERVNRLGGPGGEWREVLFKKNRWEEEDREERKRALEAYAEERGVEVEELIREAEAQDIEWEGDTGENSKGKGKEQEEEWGMKVMLKALGIAEDMLGWDQETGSWKD